MTCNYVALQNIFIHGNIFLSCICNRFVTDYQLKLTLGDSVSEHYVTSLLYDISWLDGEVQLSQAYPSSEAVVRVAGEEFVLLVAKQKVFIISAGEESVSEVWP